MHPTEHLSHRNNSRAARARLGCQSTAQGNHRPADTNGKWIYTTKGLDSMVAEKIMDGEGVRMYGVLYPHHLIHFGYPRTHTTTHSIRTMAVFSILDNESASLSLYVTHSPMSATSNLNNPAVSVAPSGASAAGSVYLMKSHDATARHENIIAVAARAEKIRALRNFAAIYPACLPYWFQGAC